MKVILIQEYIACDLKDLKDDVDEIKFLPKNYGKKLAVGFINGQISILELIILSNGRVNYEIVFTFSINNTYGIQESISTFSFNKSMYDSLTLAIGYSVKVINNNKEKQSIRFGEYIRN